VSDAELVVALQRRLSEEHVARLKAESRAAHTEYWYAVRNARLDDWARNEIPDDLRKQYFDIAANGSLANEPPTYAQQFNQMKWRAESAEEKLKQQATT